MRHRTRLWANMPLSDLSFCDKNDHHCMFLTLRQTFPNFFYGNTQVHVNGALDVQFIVGNGVRNGRWMRAIHEIDCHENSHDNKLHIERLRENGSLLVWPPWKLTFGSRLSDFLTLMLVYWKSLFFIIKILKCNVLEEIVNSFVNCDVLKIIPICLDLSYLRQWCNKENFKPPCQLSVSHQTSSEANQC